MTASEPTWRAMYEIAISAQALTREFIEALGPPASLESREAVLANRGPEPVHEAEAQIAAIGRYRDHLSRSNMAGWEMRAKRDAAEADRDALAERVRVLEEALRPFADAFELRPQDTDLGVADDDAPPGSILYRHLRRAAAALSAGGATREPTDG